MVLNGSPDGINLLGQPYNIREKPTVILYTYYINRHAEPLNITKHKNNSAIEPYNNWVNSKLSERDLSLYCCTITLIAMEGRRSHKEIRSR